MRAEKSESILLVHRPTKSSALHDIGQGDVGRSKNTAEDSRQRRRSCKKKNVARFLLAGGLAGCVAKTCVAPLERVRILAQTGGLVGGIWPSMREIIRTEGVVGFWRGNFTNCMRVLPNKGLLFAANDWWKEVLRRLLRVDELGPQWLFLSGAFAGMSATSLTYPLDMVRTRLSGSIRSRLGLVGTVRSIIKADGVTGLYRGMAPTLAGSIPYEGLKFGCYDLLKRWTVSNRCSNGEDFRDLPTIYKLSVAAAAGTFAGIVMYPNDTVRRLLQMQSEGNIKYRNTIDAYRVVLREEGFSRFYRGMPSYLFRIVPNSALQFFVYECLKDLFGLS
eukprot:g4873.t1